MDRGRQEKITGYTDINIKIQNTELLEKEYQQEVEKKAEEYKNNNNKEHNKINEKIEFDQKVEEEAEECKKGNEKYIEIQGEFFRYLKDRSAEQYEEVIGKDKEYIISKLGNGWRIKNPQENPEDIINEKYVEINRDLFVLKEFIEKDRGNQWEKEKVKEIIGEYYNSHLIPLTMDVFLNMKKERKIAIQGMLKYLKKEYNLKEHWREDLEWMLAEIMMTNIIPKFLNKLTNCDCVVFRSNRFDDIKNKIDIIITSKKISCNIGLDVTIREEYNSKGKYNLQNKENRSSEFNKNELKEAQYGIKFDEKNFLIEKIPSLAWFYTRIDKNLLKQYMLSVYEEDKEKIENIEKEIFVIFCKSIKEQFEKLKEENNKILKEYKKLKKEYKKVNKDKNEINKKCLQLEKKKDYESLKKLEETRSNLENELNSIKNDLDKKSKILTNMYNSLKNSSSFMSYTNIALNKVLNDKL